LIERRISNGELSSFFRDFSRIHHGALVSLQVGGNQQVASRPLSGISRDGKDVVVHIGDMADRLHLGHRVRRVRDVRLEQTEGGADAALVVVSADGTRTIVAFRSPMRADLLDPLVE
jgi:hypothetical protein